MIGALCLLITAAVGFFYRHGYVLYYGDAQAHINIARSIIDSRTPGYSQIGTVWLPMLHVLCLPLVANDALWSTGLAGTIPVAACFVIAGTFLYLLAEDIYGSRMAAIVVTACFALNPNVLYLGAIPMTEIVFLAALSVMLFALFRFLKTQKRGFVALALSASWCMSLTRYDGWFLIPFAALFCAAFAKRRRMMVFLAFAILASLAPLYWLAHNYWETGNALDFYNGPESAMAIQGPASYPGREDWFRSIEYYAKAGELCAGPALVVLGVLGLACALKKRTAAPLLFFALTPIFYIWSIHSAGTPIFVPQLWPYSYYNTRYGIAVVILAAFAAGAIVTALPRRWLRFAPLLIIISVLPWLLRPSQEHWVCWKESQVNSTARRAWIEAGARYFRNHYPAGEGVLVTFGDAMGIFCRARIPLAETLHRTNGPEWIATIAREDLWHRPAWAIGLKGDPVSTGIGRTQYPVYRAVKRIEEPGNAFVTIYNRELGAGK